MLRRASSIQRSINRVTPYHTRFNQVDVVIPIQEGRQYFFGNVSFTGKKIYDAETLRGQIQDLLSQPYTDARVADIPRRLQTYYKARGYYDVKVEGDGRSDGGEGGSRPGASSGLSRSHISLRGTFAECLTRLHPAFVEKRFVKLRGQTYSPDVLDEKIPARSCGLDCSTC